MELDTLKAERVKKFQGIQFDPSLVDLVIPHFKKFMEEGYLDNL